MGRGIPSTAITENCHHDVRGQKDHPLKHLTIHFAIEADVKPQKESVKTRRSSGDQVGRLRASYFMC